MREIFAAPLDTVTELWLDNDMTKHDEAALFIRIANEFFRRAAQVGEERAMAEAAAWHPIAPAIINAVIEVGGKLVTA